MFGASPVLLAAKYNKWQIRHLRKVRELHKAAQERKREMKRLANPRPVSSFFHTPTWKKLVAEGPQAVTRDLASKKQPWYRK